MWRHYFTAAVFVSGALAIGTTAEAATRTSGIYLTAADYQNAQLTSEGDCTSKSHSIELHDVLNRPYIDVTHDGNRRRYLKTEIFGFRSCEGADYRFAGNKEYQILEAKTLYIYRTVASDTRGKGATQVATYFFSVGGGGDVLALTALNLKQAFPANHRFHDSLDAAFTLGGLEQYDAFHKMFKVNRLLEASEGR